MRHTFVPPASVEAFLAAQPVLASDPAHSHENIKVKIRRFCIVARPFVRLASLCSERHEAVWTLIESCLQKEGT